MYLSVQEKEEANSVFKRFETRPSCVRPVRTEHRAWMLNWALSHLFLFACLNCDLYLFVQVQEEAKESSVRCCCLWDAALCMRTEHGARVLSWVFPRLVFECFKLFWMFKLARLKKHVQMISFRDDAQQWPVNCPEHLFRLASANRLRLQTVKDRLYKYEHWRGFKRTHTLRSNLSVRTLYKWGPRISERRRVRPLSLCNFG